MCHDSSASFLIERGVFTYEAYICNIYGVLGMVDDFQIFWEQRAYCSGKQGSIDKWTKDWQHCRVALVVGLDIPLLQSEKEQKVNGNITRRIKELSYPIPPHPTAHNARTASFTCTFSTSSS